jgi:hypothetical protein
VTHFYSETDISRMYDEAELALTAAVQSRKLLVIDERQPAKSRDIQKISRSIVDAIVRGASMNDDDEDITVLPGLDVSRFNEKESRSA